ncbi:hypothetical protein WN943_000005 [Citrus x changshan-huyou]
MSVKMRTTCTWTERPYEASLFPGIGFGLFLRSLGGRRRRPPSGGARAISVEEPHQSIPNLVVKLYCGDDTVGEVLRKNSSTPG